MKERGITVSIQSSSVVQKMIDRLEKIKDDVDRNPSSSRVKEELGAVKAYCDLLLEAPATDTSTAPAPKGNIVKQPHQPVQTLSVKKRDEEDDVNGDSIFDF